MTKSDWLRSEIEKLEGMKLRDCTKGGYGHSHNPWGCGEKLCEYCKHMEDGLCESNHGYSSVEVMVYNQALTSIITRYKEELKEMGGKKTCEICHGFGNNGADDAQCLNCGGSGEELKELTGE